MNILDDTVIQEDLGALSAFELEALIACCEGAIFMGVSTHQDIITLVDAEAELQRREREAFRHSLRTERQLKVSGTGTGDNGALAL